MQLKSEMRKIGEPPSGSASTTQRAHFQFTFSNLTPQSPKMKSKDALMKFKDDPYYPSPWDTQIFPGFAKIGHLMIFSLKSGVTRSIIEQFLTFSTNGGYSDFTQSI